MFIQSFTYHSFINTPDSCDSYTSNNYNRSASVHVATFNQHRFAIIIFSHTGCSLSISIAIIYQLSASPFIFQNRKKSPISATNTAEDQQQDIVSHQQPSTCSPDVIVQQPTCQQPAFLTASRGFMRNSLETVTEAGSSPSPSATEEEQYEETVPPTLVRSQQ
ncbi:hypothetical protein O0I10_004780 [Lichtheimia ornata]|uniref:Uncharacterized protein n=1 Tax=Lichtheimia ornata TaxID=688661 RepID=A0AAD7V7N0_9FUNG|nr:uncharacterized protein O0I10_004780 [Lichtheimia ornata]KAJ8659417.1 hypothetical protein O0I10_004780 [Lichtheimia ornata]